MAIEPTEMTGVRTFRHRIFIRSLLAFFLVLCAMATLLYLAEVRFDVESLKREQLSVVQQRQQLVGEYFSHIHADLFYLSRQNELISYLKDGTLANWRSLSGEYLNFVQSHHSYDQVRFLDLQGQEVARANYNNAQPYLVPRAQLQDKGDRYYFKRSIVLDPGQIFTSVFDLNIETRQVQIPYKPMLRFATPVEGSTGEKSGILIINYLGQYLLQAIARGSELLHSELMLLNPQSYWLLHPNQDLQWGFQFPNKQGAMFANTYPDAWGQILASDAGQFETAKGIFTFATIYPPFMKIGRLEQQIVAAEAPETMRFWKLVSLVPQSALALANQRTQLLALMMVGSLTILAIYPCWRFAVEMARRSYYRQEVTRLAHLDKLTGLTSRALFDDRLLQGLERAKRAQGQFALLYIDLDGFKAVNDQFGHAVGDDVLQNVALRMRRLVRRADTIARVGGDEFCIIVEGLSLQDGAAEVAEKLLAGLRERFEVKGQEAQIGASIGISFYPQHGETAETLLKKADEAMYLAKKSGRNAYRIATE